MTITVHKHTSYSSNTKPETLTFEDVAALKAFLNERNLEEDRCVYRIVGQNFEGADLTNLQAYNTSWEKCDFWGANLSGTSVAWHRPHGSTERKASFTKCEFTDADLSQGNWSTASFDSCNFKSANMSWSNFSDSSIHLPRKLASKRCDSFQGADISGSLFAYKDKTIRLDHALYEDRYDRLGNPIKRRLFSWKGGNLDLSFRETLSRAKGLESASFAYPIEKQREIDSWPLPPTIHVTHNSVMAEGFMVPIQLLEDIYTNRAKAEELPIWWPQHGERVLAAYADVRTGKLQTTEDVEKALWQHASQENEVRRHLHRSRNDGRIKDDAFPEGTFPQVRAAAFEAGRDVLYVGAGRGSVVTINYPDANADEVEL